ncbi:hypothetical protein CI102_12665 [Trichoderma harzianum]|nr:hypothetical protein CI102_12665 [Trichoderma harzianum]
MVPSSKQHWLPAIRRQVRGTGTGMPMRGKRESPQLGKFITIASRRGTYPEPRPTGGGGFCCATSQSYAAGQVPVQVPLPGLVAPCDAKLAGEPLRKRATHGELLFQFPPTPLDISNGRRWGCCHGIAWVSSAPEPGAGSVQFLPQATLGNTTPTPQEGPGNGLWLGRQHFGPSTLGGWCAGSVLRELPAGTPDFASRQSAPSPSDWTPPRWT